MNPDSGNDKSVGADSVPLARVTHLRHISLECPDLPASIQFFEKSWGLELCEQQNRTAYFAAQSAEPYVLSLRSGPHRRIDHVAFGLSSIGEVDRAEAVARERGIPIVAPAAALDGPGGGHGFRIADLNSLTVELSAEVEEEKIPAVLVHDRPIGLAHLVFNTPQIEQSERFWRETLGFRVSDWSEQQMVFLRCGREHHAIAFNASSQPSYNHTAWTMVDIDGLFRAQGRIAAAGTPLAWGTGRHGPGGQVFNYFIEPSGYVVEAIADGIQIEEESTWTPQVWQRSPDAMDLWGTSGPPSAVIRTAMTNES